MGLREEAIVRLEKEKAELQQQLSEKDKTISELKAWKESSMSVTPDMQAIGKAIGVKLGHSVHDKILPAIKSQQQEIERLKGLIFSAFRYGNPDNQYSGFEWEQFKKDNKL